MSRDVLAMREAEVVALRQIKDELVEAMESLLKAATEVFEHPEYGAVLKARRVIAKATGKEAV